MTLLLDQSLSFATAFRLSRASRDQRDTFSRLATGVRVRTGADGPADLIRATKLEADLRQTEQSVLNAERAAGAVSVADAALDQVTENLREVRRLVMESTSNTLTTAERDANQDQIDRILRQTDRIFFDTEYAGTRLFRSVPKDTQAQEGIGMNGQVGHIDAAQATPGTTQRFNFARTLNDPVVIVGPLSHNDGDPAHVRVHNVDDNGFDFEIEEWDYLDGVHGTERFGYLALEPGVHTLKDGTIVEVGRANVNHNFQWVNFSAAFDRVPTILTSVQTENDATPVNTRIRNDQINRFRVRV
ncbi:MAG: flagellin, partial [Planctomycetota bacterium]